MHRPHGMDLGAADVELALLLLDARAHVPDHRSVLAAQPFELEHLLGQVAPADVDRAPGFNLEVADARRHALLQDFLTLAQHTLAQGALQQRQLARLQQGRVVIDLGDQALLGRHRDHLLQPQTEDFRRGCALAVDLGLHLGRGAQRVPHRVDLVQDHQPGIGAVGFADQVFAPDRQVGLGDAGVRREDENHGVGLRDQVDSQLWLCADRVQAGSVQNHQTLFEQRMCDVDQRMTPARNFDQAVGTDQRVVLHLLVAPEAERLGIFDRHVPDFGDLFEGLRQLCRIVDIEIDADPFLWNHAPFHQRLGLDPGLDRQQPQAGRHVAVVTQLGRAHRGSAGAGRHDAALVAGEKDGVDELGLAARELGDKGHHDLVGSHLRFEPAQAFFDRGVEQLMISEPFGQQLQAQRELASPDAVLVELVVKRSAH